MNTEARRAYLRAYYAKNKERMSAYQKKWIKSEKGKAYITAYNNNPKNRAKKRISGAKSQREKRARMKGYKTQEYREYRRRFPEKVRAHRILNKAIKKGLIKRLPCEVCKAKRVHAHHDDYSKPLKVRWLCPVHHKAIH